MTDQTPPHRRSPMEHERDAAMDYLASAGQAYDRIGWQPIETAPKSPVEDGCSFGPIIALASTSAHRALGYWSNGEGARPAGWVNPHDHRVMEYWNAFTHWMPLPPLHGEDTAP